MGSIYLCCINFLLVAFGNGVMTNDWWCRDETESLLWCTHGWAARHALVSRLIVVSITRLYWCAIFCGYSLRMVAAFCLDMSRYSNQICLQYLVRYPLIILHLSSVWELHASPPLNILIRISGRDSFKGGRLWHPRYQFCVTSRDLS
jgi:hypothetical protein